MVGPARQDCLLRQMEEAHVHIFGFQETRLRRISNAHDERFWLFRSAATPHGHYGILIGLSRLRPIGQIHKDGAAHDVFIQQEDVALIATDTRYRFCVSELPCFKQSL